MRKLLTVCLVVLCGSLIGAPSTLAVTATGVFDGASSVTAFNFPTSSVAGTSSRVRSPDFTMRISSGSVPTGSTWRVHALVTSAFTGPGGSIAASNFAVQGPVQGTGWSTLATEQNVQTSIAATTLTSGAFRLRFIPPAGLKAGDYTGNIRIRAQQYNSGGTSTGTSDRTVSATVHVLGYVAVLDIRNVTADVVAGMAPNSAVTTLAFPTQSSTAGRKVRSDSLRVRANTNTAWDLYASIDAPFTLTGDPTRTKPVSSFGVCVAPCSTINNFTASGARVLVANAVAAGTSAQSPIFQLVSRSVATEAGTYNGSFTFTILVD